jgi:uncharacterized membrane protein HdeD (DUF308 family)
MENSEKTSSAASVLGIISLILGILAIVLAFIPYVGIAAMFPGTIALILAIIAFFLATKHQSKGLILAAFILSVFSIVFAYWQYNELKNKAKQMINKTGDEFKNTIDNMESLDSLNSNDDMKQRLDSM